MEIRTSFDFRNKQGNVFSVKRVNTKDAWGICDFVVSNETRLVKFFPVTRAANLTPNLSNRFVELKARAFDNNEEFLYLLRREGFSRIIGMIYIKELDWDKRVGELAYAIDYNYRGMGITTLLIQGIKKVAFEDLDLKTLQIISYKSNISSIRVAEKNNFVWVKTLLKSFAPPGKKFLDMELYECHSDYK